MTDVQGQKGLFAAAPYMSAEKRYPRGYTPGRMAEVRRGLESMQPNGKLVPGTTTERLSMQSKIVPEQGLRELGLSKGSRAAVHGLHARAIHEAIARSTVPRHQLHAVGSIKVDEQTLNQMNAGGYFEPATHTIAMKSMKAGDHRFSGSPNNPEASAKSQRQADTLIHELGHSRSYNDGARNRERRFYPTEKDSRGLSIIGPEEAYADDFMVRHRRQDPRDVRQNGAQPPETYMSSGTLHHGNRSYVEARQNWGSEIEQQISRSNDEWEADKNVKREAAVKKFKTEGIQQELPGVTRLAVTKNPHLDPRPGQSGPRPAALEGNHLNGRQFSGT